MGQPGALSTRVNEKPKSLPHPDNRHLEAAEGWLGLGNWQYANDELDQISDQFHAHPYVLELRYKVHGAAKRWDMAIEVAKTACEILPDEPWGHFYMAFALHEMKRTQEAYDTLKPVVDKFPEEQIMHYNLACYACQLGRLKEAMDWIEKSAGMEGKHNIRKLALEDKDLEPLWGKIKEM
jgi:predicted Zn-dependent protease